MAILDVTQSPYNAVGDGVADDGPAVQSALDALTAGDLAYFPGGTYRTTQGLTLTAIPSGVYGDGVNVSIIKYDNASPADLLTITGATDYSRVSRLSLDGSGQASNCLVLNGGFAHFAEFDHFRVLSPIDAGVAINSAVISCAFKSVSCAGGNYGVFVDDSARLSGAMFEHLRISNTLEAAVYLRNAGNSLHAFSIFHPTLEGNRGSALDLGGGMQCRVYGGHFEQNGTTSGKPDILLGRFSSSTAPLCELHLFGPNFSTKGAAQTNTRVLFQEIGGQLRLYGIRNTSTFTIDMNGKTTGSLVQSISSSQIFEMINGTREKLIIYDRQCATAPNHPGLVY